jgi:hypothetical protein
MSCTQNAIFIEPKTRARARPGVEIPPVSPVEAIREEGNLVMIGAHLLA